jgi:hypothetical protein
MDGTSRGLRSSPSLLHAREIYTRARDRSPCAQMDSPPVLYGLAERTAPLSSRLVSTCGAVAVCWKRDRDLDPAPAGCSGVGGSLQRGAVTERGANIRGCHPIPLLMLTPVGEVPVQLIGGRVLRDRAALKTSAFAAEAGLLLRWRSASATLDRRRKGGDRGAAAGLYDRALEDPVPREEPEERPVEQPAEPLEPELPRR